MRYFDTPQTITVPAPLIDKARAFAKQVTPTVGTPGQGYRDTAQLHLPKIELDHCISKIGEEAVRLVFEQHQRTVRGPDYTIYHGKQKSWAADLFVDDIPLAVKSQATRMAQRFELSWTFQAAANRRDPILNQPDAWVCFVEVNEVNGVCRVFPAYQIKALPFDEPRLAKLRGVKKAVYAKHLK